MEIWENNKLYTILRHPMDFCIRMCFRKYEVIGAENIPEDGAVIIAPNHSNTLMDALVVLASRPAPSSFGARADIFSTDTIKKLMNFLRLVPIYRARDGFNKVEKNREMTDTILKSIDNGIPFVIFPEGTHRAKHSLLPLKKGVARLANECQEILGDSKKVYIVPCGIEYGDYFHFRTTCRINYGKPMDITQIKSEHPQAKDAELYALLLGKLKDELSSLFTYLEDDETYDKCWEEIEKQREDNTIYTWELPVIVLLFPFALALSIYALPQLIATICILRKIKDHAWNNTVRFGCKIVGILTFVPLLTIAMAIVSGSLLTTLSVFVVALFAYTGYYVYWELLRNYLRKRNLLK